MTINPDFIIIGGGPNGLSAGAYLAKAGLKVLVMDCNQEMGGGLATEMVTFPGFLSNTHAIYHMMVDFAPAFKDLDIQSKYGVKFVFPDLQSTMLFADGRSLCLYRDVEKTCRSIAQFSKKDADSYRNMHRQFDAYMKNYLGPLTYLPAMAPLDQIPMLEKTELGREFCGLAEKSPKELIDDIFENDRVRAHMYYIACHWGLEYDTTGLGFMAILNLNRATNYRMSVGGSHKLTQALVKAILENGGKLLGSQWIKKIIIEDGTAKGVELENGTIVRAEKGVLSTIDLDTTFLKYVGEKNLESDFADSIRGWEWEKWSLLGIHLALQEPPAFKAAAENKDIDQSLSYIMGYESTQDVINHWQGIEQGKRQVAGFTASFPSVHDPLQAPLGKSTGLISQIAPYNITEGVDAWENFKFKWELINERVDFLKQYAPNINKENVIWGYAVTPLGVERRFPDMVKGSIKQGKYTSLQMGNFRPNIECSDHRTPIKNLWLGGANTYPGGLVILGSGYLAANAVAEDIGINKWWSEPECVTDARSRGMIE